MIIDLWSLQTDQFVEYLFENGISWDVQKPDDAMFEHAYNWLIEQMCVQQNRMDKKYPIWAWYQYSFDRPRPDMRISSLHDHLRQAPNMLHLRVPRSRVTLTNYDRWHAPLNNCYCYLDDNDVVDNDFEIGQLNINMHTQQKIYKSWQSIFDISITTKDNFSPIQATLFEIYPQDIISIKRWKNA